MHKTIIAILTTTFLFAGLKVVSLDSQTGIEEEIQLYENTYALIIGIDNYSNLDFNWQLQYAVKDAKGVAKSMRDNFEFNDIIELYNERATKNNILQALSNFITTKKDDGIFIFFAGHGHTESTLDGDLGYIIPHDGSMNKIEMYKNISMNELKDFLKPILAKHVFVVVDACYSGTLLTTRGVQEKPEPDLGYLREITKGRVRQVLTAGGKGQQVLDGGPGGHSVFTGYFLQFLENASNYITASQLGYKLPEEVFKAARDRNHNQSPVFGNLLGEGDFVFITKKSQSSQRTPSRRGSSTSGFGSYYITSNPEGARVWIDDTEITGITPLEVDNQSAGEHTIYVEKGNYSAETIAFLEPDDLVKINLPLNLGRGKLKISSTPFEAKVYIDGVLKGETPMMVKDLMAGEHILKLIKKGYSELTKMVFVKSNQLITENISLGQKAELMIASLPTRAQIYINGDLFGTTPKNATLNTGKYNIVIKREDYYDKEITVDLGSGDNEELNLDLDHHLGSLFVYSDPPEADIFLDGDMAGKTPLKVTDLNTGKHNIKIMKSGYYTTTETVTVKVDKITNYDLNLMSHASVKAQLKKIKGKKSFWLVSGLVFTGAGAYYKMSSDKHFTEYGTATNNAKALHELIEIENQIYTTSFGLGGACFLRAFTLNSQEKTLKQKWQ